MKRFVPIAFIGFLMIHPAFAQPNKAVPGLREVDSLKNVLKAQNDDTNKVNTLNALSQEHEILSNYDSALSYAERAQVLAEKIGFKKGVANALRNFGRICYHRSDYQKSLEYHFKAFTIYQNIGNKRGMADALNIIGGIYFTLGNYSKALDYFFKALATAQEIGNKIIVADVLCNIGIIYEEQGNYHKELEYQLISLGMHIEMGTKNAIVTDLGDIGYGYLSQGNYPKALEYDFKAVTLAQELGAKDANSNFLGDIGIIYYKQGDYTRALEYNFKAIAIARGIGDIDEAATLYSNMGEVYTKLKNYKQAKNFLDSALNFSKKTGNKRTIKITYGILTTLDSATGNYKSAYADHKKYIVYRDSLINQRTAQIEISYEFEKREDSISAAYKEENIIKTAENNRKKILSEGAIAILALTVLLALLLINRQQIKRKNEKTILEKEKQQLENELATNKAMLDDYVKNMVEKNRLIEQFKTDIEKLKNLKSKELEEVRIEQLENLNKTSILTEEDWDKFKELFEQVYKGFLIRLKEKLPTLTQAEIRLICLTKLKLDTKQMAHILGISPDTIVKARYRMRKKLGLSIGANLSDIDKSL